MMEDLNSERNRDRMASAVLKLDKSCRSSVFVLDSNISDSSGS